MAGNRVSNEMLRRRQPKEASAWTKLTLLMWKNFLQQWRHRIQTVVELLLPIVTMTLVLILRWQIEPSTVNTIHYQPFPAHSINRSMPILAAMNITQLSIAYSPTSSELDDVIRTAISRLLVRNIDVILDNVSDLLPGNITIEIPPDIIDIINIDSTIAVEFIKRFITVHGYDNSTQLGTIYALEETTREVIAAIEFDDDLFGATTLSSNLSYSLRFPEVPRLSSFFNQGARTWRTDLVFPTFETPGPRSRNSQVGGNNPGYVVEMFIALQQSISTELIARFTGAAAIRNYSLYMQRYPHPAFVQDAAVEALQFIFPMFIMLSFSYTAVNIVRAVTVEKELQLKEAMKIMGLPTWLHWTAWFCKQFIFLLVTVIFIVVLLKMNWFSNEDGFNEYAVFTNTPWSVLFFFILLYLTSTIFFCFMISGIFSKGGTASLFTGVIWFLTYIPAFLLTMDLSMSTPMQIFTCLLHNSAMSYGFILLLGQESTGGNRVSNEMLRRRQPKEASAWTKLTLLMWKNFLQQWRHRIQTVVELLLPIVTMTLVLILRWQIEPSTVNTIHYQPFPAHSINRSMPILAAMNITQLSIAYSPTSSELDDVIRTAISRLLVRNIDVILDNVSDLLPGNITIEIPPDIIDIINIDSTIAVEFIKRFITVHGYDNSTQLGTIYALEETTREVIAAIEFDDDLFGATTLSSNLSYSLRFPEVPRLSSFFNQGARTWRTDLVFPTFETPGPRSRNSQVGGNNPGYVVEMFIALQQSISTELIARFTGAAAIRNYSLYMQRYPHPAFVQDAAVEALQFIFPMFIMLSFSYTAVNIVRAVTVEKELQLKEAMKIMGLPTWLHWTAWFCKQFIFLLVTVIFIVVLLKMNWFSNEDGFNEYAVFTNTPWSVLFFFILLYLTSTIFFCFMISGIFSKGGTASLFTGVIWFLTYIPAFLLTMDLSMSTPMQIFTCLLHNSAMSYGFILLLGQESTGGLQWGEFFSSPSTDSTRFVFGHVVLMLSLDCVIYMLIALYLEKVFPGPYGTPQKWYFLFQKNFWCPIKDTRSLDMIPDFNTNDDLVKERDPTGHEVGVNMHKLTKIYGTNIAVNNLSMNIYDDQITVLLGHNGAGKSTTISMLTGNLEMSYGSVHIAGYDISTQIQLARSHIGLCPQHNVLFNELTVREHLQFFATLKGFSGAELKEDIDSLITKLELEEKRDYKAEGLSGGQKRRLNVGIALSGATRVVLLDEPTSGMDPASRRALWDLLQKEKKDRTIILTTHFMDEADILGDRIAIMAHGRLQCVGSPYFLKRHYGVGYTLVIVKTDGFDVDICTEIMRKYIPGITPKEDRLTEVTYSLTNDHSQKFEEMLNDLERNIDLIKFKNYGLVATTLEDVFMSVGSDVASVHSATDDGATSTVESTHDLSKDSMDELNKDEEGVTGIRLLWQRILAIWLKLWLVWIRSWWLILLQLIVPLLLINLTLLVLEYIVSFVETVQIRPLTVASGYANTETLLSFNGTSLSSLGALAKEAYKNIFINSGMDTLIINDVQSQPIEEYYLERAADPVSMASMRHSVVIGATFDEAAATAWFSNFGYHDIAASLATVHEALLKAFNSTAIINVFNHPLEATYEDRTDIQTMATLLSMQLSSGIGSSIGIVSAVFIMFYIKEAVSGAKLLQKAAGVQPLVLWGSASVFDWLWFCIICLTIPISCAIFQVTGLSTLAELGRMYLLLMIYGAAMLPFNYLFSGAFRGPAMGFVVMFFINMLLGMMGPQIVEALSSPQLDTEEVARILDIILQIFPLYSLVTAARELVQIGITETTCLRGCDYISILLPNLEECTIETMCEHFSSTCCIPENPFFDWEAPGILRYITVMLITCVIFWALLMILEYRIVQKIFTIRKTPPHIDESTIEEDVADEAEHVHRIDKANLKKHGLVSKNLSKYYGKHLAVDQISFSVNDSECFGLLGVNGAGKTTTFKMLMGDETISSGEAFVSGHSVRSDLPKVYENIGYCPQFDALFGELTGRETLQLFSLMRGLNANNSIRAEALAQSLGFLKHLDKKVDEYSGGTKRKLNTAVAFLGRTRLVFVDEPTTGVDPAAKRHVWRSMRSVQRSGRGVVLTSHSMEECEALCSRLTIMVNGRFQCLGTPQHLKNKFSQGFTLTVKLRTEDTRTSMSENALDSVKEYINANFLNPNLMEEYQGLLTYYLPDRSMPWSKMFGIMERGKRDLEIEDYSISQTTLEQIFLQFTKYQREGTVSK